jgi:hypothetical protein
MIYAFRRQGILQVGRCSGNDTRLTGLLAPQPICVLCHPVVALLISLCFFFGPRFYRWLHVPIEQLHRALGNLERELDRSTDKSIRRLSGTIEMGSAVRLLVARPCVVDLQLSDFICVRFKNTDRMAAAIDDARCRTLPS